MTLASPTPQTKTFRVALVGNPNTGKTTLFNVLTGLNQKVGNYPGVTVERKVGRFQRNNLQFELVDLPGTYSLAARSLDEMVVIDVLLGKQTGEHPIDIILAVVDASNINRNMYLLSQIVELGLPVVVALTMQDVAVGKGITVDHVGLSRELGLPIVPVNPMRRVGTKDVAAAVEERVLQGGTITHKTPALYQETSAVITELQDFIVQNCTLTQPVHDLELYRALMDEGGYAEQRLTRLIGPAFAKEIQMARLRLQTGESLSASEVVKRYQWVNQILKNYVVRPERPVLTRSDYIDRVLTHPVWGFAIFIVLMALVFQSIYTWAGPLMDMIDGMFAALAYTVVAVIPEGALQSLIVDGIIGGVGGVLIFLPQIAILFLFIGILEDCGYMPRAAFMMDRLLSRFGLSGKSFIPLLSSFACAVPGIMATRTIENRGDRMTTIMIAPLMSCSARLPVYLILIAAFIPNVTLFAGLNLQAFTLLCMYLLGILIAIPVALIFKRVFHTGGQRAPFVLEFPSFKVPSPRSIALYVYERCREFVVRAGTIIFCFAVIIWFLSYFPRPDSIEVTYAQQREAAQETFYEQTFPILHELDPVTYPEGMTSEAFHVTAGEDPRLIADEESRMQENSTPVQQAAENYSEYTLALERIANEENGAYVRTSYIGRMGHAIEPLVEPLGWDWRIGVAALASFPARELVVASLGTILNVGDEADESSTNLRDALRETKRPDGSSLFNIGVALSLMVFFALCAQCVSTLAIIRRETNSWIWSVVAFSYLTLLAYFGAMVTYQVSRLFGLA